MRQKLRNVLFFILGISLTILSWVIAAPILLLLCFITLVSLLWKKRKKVLRIQQQEGFSES